MPSSPGVEATLLLAACHPGGEGKMGGNGITNCKFTNQTLFYPDIHKGRLAKKTRKCGNFFQVGDPPPSSPQFGNPMFVKENHGLFCILGP